MYVIVILAMIAGFLALRLYSVLGKRTGHEQEPALRPAEDRAKVTVLQPGPMSQGGSDSVRLAEGLIAPGAETGVRALIAEMPEWIQWAFTCATLGALYESHASLCRFVLRPGERTRAAIHRSLARLVHSKLIARCTLASPSWHPSCWRKQ